MQQPQQPAPWSCLQTLMGHDKFVCTLALLSNERLASGSRDKTIKIWNLDSGKCEQTLTGHYSDVLSLALLSNGRLASASADLTIKIWNFVSGKCEQTLKGHDFPIQSLATLSNGRLASGSLDATIKIWFVGEGKEPEAKAAVPANGRLASDSLAAAPVDVKTAAAPTQRRQIQVRIPTVEIKTPALTTKNYKSRMKKALLQVIHDTNKKRTASGKAPFAISIEESDDISGKDNPECIPVEHSTQGTKTHPLGLLPALQSFVARYNLVTDSTRLTSSDPNKQQRYLLMVKPQNYYRCCPLDRGQYAPDTLELLENLARARIKIDHQALDQKLPIDTRLGSVKAYENSIIKDIEAIITNDSLPDLVLQVFQLDLQASINKTRAQKTVEEHTARGRDLTAPEMAKLIDGVEQDIAQNHFNTTMKGSKQALAEKLYFETIGQYVKQQGNRYTQYKRGKISAASQI